jgi:hypothetical protein
MTDLARLVRPGDAIAFYGADWLCPPFPALYSWITWRPWYGLRRPPSHVGIALTQTSDGQVMLLEATTTVAAPCVVRQRSVSGPQVHPLAERLDAFSGPVAVLRLTPEVRVAAAFANQTLWDLAYAYCDDGEDYDLSHAVWSGIPFLRLCRLLAPLPTDARVFCSELLMRAYRALRLHDRSPEGWSPASALWWLRRQGILGPPQWLKR